MQKDCTTVVVQRYLDELAGVSGASPAEPLVRELLGRSAGRLQMLCATLLYRSYPRLARPPLNLNPEEMLSSVVERLLKALRDVRPGSVRQFFALANQHMRWELNDLARRLDKHARLVELQPSRMEAPADDSESQLSPNTRLMLEAIEKLPEEEREVFDLVRLQGMTQPEAAEIVGVSAKTVQRRLNRSLVLLAAALDGLKPPALVDGNVEASTSKTY